MPRTTWITELNTSWRTKCRRWALTALSFAIAALFATTVNLWLVMLLHAHNIPLSPG